MNAFSDYMDNVRAEEALKEKTKDYVRTALLNPENQDKTADSGAEFRKNRLVIKRFLVAVSSAAACLFLALGANAYYHTPVNYVCLDINPSVELGINAFGRVVSAQPYNDDGLRLLDGNAFSNLSTADAVGTLVRGAAEQGFIAGDGSTVIAVTAESDSADTAAELQSSIEAQVDSALSASGISAIVYSDCTDLQLREQAKEAGLSPGKLRLIRILQTLDPDITIADYKNAKITDIVAKANALASSPGSGSRQNGDYAEALEKIRDAARQVQAAYANAEQAQNGGEQNQAQIQASDTQQQGQNQDSNSGQQQTQGQAGQVQNQAPENSPSDTGQNGGQAAGAPSETKTAAQDSGGKRDTASAQAGPETAADSSSGSSSGMPPGNGKGGK
ncbi:MAG: hypothetical protein AB7D36_11110 [Oscillospiraceae bacterium]